MLEIGFTSPEDMVDFFPLLKKSIRSEEKADLESGSSRLKGMFVIEQSCKPLAGDNYCDRIRSRVHPASQVHNEVNLFSRFHFSQMLWE